jgi:hypothetical protein
MVDVTIKSEDVDNLVRAVRTHADAKALRRELYRGLNRETKDTRRKITDAIPEALPRRGGLAERMRSQVSSSTTVSSRGGVALALRFKSRGYDMKTLTEGRIRHPVFARDRGRKAGGTALASERGSWTWVEQTAGVDSEHFLGEFDDQRPDLLRAIQRVLDEVARKVTNI